jgi:hypothetical protein
MSEVNYMRLRKRIIQAEKKEINHEEIAQKMFGVFNINEIKEYTLGKIKKLEPQIKNDTTDENNQYKIILEQFGEETGDDQVFELGVMFGVLDPSVEMLNSTGFSNTWIHIKIIAEILAEKITNATNLDGYYEFSNKYDNKFSLIYVKPHYQKDHSVKEFLEDSAKSYERNYNRFKELPNIIMDAYSQGRTEDAKKLEEEYNELKKIVTAKKIKQKRLLK